VLQRLTHTAAAKEMEKMGMYVSVYGSVLQYVAVCCSVLQCFTHMAAAKEMEKMGMYVYVLHKNARTWLVPK